MAAAVAQIKRQRPPRLHVGILGETSERIGLLLERQEIGLAVGRFTDPLQHNKIDFTALSDDARVLPEEGSRPQWCPRRRTPSSARRSSPHCSRMQSSDALAMLPESVVRDHVKARLLHALPLVVGQGQRAFSLFTPKDDEAVRGCAVVVAQV